MKSASGTARNQEFRQKRIVAAKAIDALWAAMPQAEVVFQQAFRRQTAMWGGQAAFLSVDMSDQENKAYWARLWNTTEIQLKIAVSRVGSDPLSVKQDIFGS